MDAVSSSEFGKMRHPEIKARLPLRVEFYDVADLTENLDLMAQYFSVYVNWADNAVILEAKPQMSSGIHSTNLGKKCD